jgi:hypothetical protein
MHEIHRGKKKSAKSLNLALVRPGMAKKINWRVGLVADRIEVSSEVAQRAKV